MQDAYIYVYLIDFKILTTFENFFLLAVQHVYKSLLG